MTDEEAYKKYAAGSEELVTHLVEENAGWAASIARSVARAWNLDWQLDGLDGGAYEGLVFCARRYDPVRGVPFRAYARRRIHEASTEEARKSKGWKQGTGPSSKSGQPAREVSAQLFDVFPELRDGLLPEFDDGSDDSMRSSIRQLLASASVLATLNEVGTVAERAFEYKQMLSIVASLEPIHQEIIWKTYYGGASLRGLADEWGIDELTIIREHKELLHYLSTKLSNPHKIIKKPKIRPSLRGVAQKHKQEKGSAPFSAFLANEPES